MKRILLSLFIFMLLCTNTGFGYELATHGAITWEAYHKSVLGSDTKFWRNLGIDPAAENPWGNFYYDVSGSDVRERSANDFEKKIIEVNLAGLGAKHLTIIGWLLRGAIREDDSYGEDNPQDDTFNPTLRRPLHHFFDPVTNRPLTVTGIGMLDPDVHTAPAWAIGTTNADAFTPPNTPEVARRNHFAVFDAREAMYRALTGRRKDGNAEPTAATHDSRKKYWATTSRALGDILHLNQDMAQPQHTRNDSSSSLHGRSRA